MTNTRPAGVTAIVVLSIVTALTALTFALLTATGHIPLSSGSFLLGGGFEQLGPVAFVVYAAILLALAVALWNRVFFARRAALLVAIIGIALAAPAISSAVVDLRLFAIAREGLEIILRVMIVFYLSREPIKDWFARSSNRGAYDVQIRQSPQGIDSRQPASITSPSYDWRPNRIGGFFTGGLMGKGFRDFIMRGNVVDLAVGVVIGATFGGVVSGFVKDLLTPLIGAVVGKPDFSGLVLEVHGGKFLIGDFLNALISFLLIASAVYFFVVLPLNALMNRFHHIDTQAPNKMKCPECRMDIPVDARKCAYCTSPIQRGKPLMSAEDSRQPGSGYKAS
jgi:large conductance mechanosensitive channel